MIAEDDGQFDAFDHDDLVGIGGYEITDEDQEDAIKTRMTKENWSRLMVGIF